MTEERVTNPATGGAKGQKLARFDLVPTRPLVALAEHFGYGAEKYEPRNWERGVDWSLNYAALMRHITAWWGGADLDEEGHSHLAAAMWHCCVLIEYAQTHPELDDRPTTTDYEDFLQLKGAYKEPDPQELAGSVGEFSQTIDSEAAAAAYRQRYVAL